MSSRPAAVNVPAASSTRTSGTVVGPNLGQSNTTRNSINATAPPSTSVKVGVKGSVSQSNTTRNSINATAAPPSTSVKVAPKNVDIDVTVEEYNEDEENGEGEPQADRTYKYACGGRNIRPGNLKGKKVEWTATIECPLEELIYPSLQHFDDVATEIYDATGITQEMNMVMKKESSSGEFTGLTPKWVANIDDTQLHELLSPQAEALKDRYSVTDINTRGEMHLRRRLKESAGADLLMHANGWPLLHGTLPTSLLTDTILPTVHFSLLPTTCKLTPLPFYTHGKPTLFSPSPHAHNILTHPSFPSFSYQQGKPKLTETEKITAAMYMELRQAHTFTSIENPKRAALAAAAGNANATVKQSTTYSGNMQQHYRASERQSSDDITEHAIRQALANKMAHKQAPSNPAASSSSRGLSKSTGNLNSHSHSPAPHSKYPTQSGGMAPYHQHHPSSPPSHGNYHHHNNQPVSPVNESEVERKRRHNLESMQSNGFSYSPDKQKDLSNSTYLETNGELSIFKPKVTEGTRRAPVKPLGYVSRMKTAMKHTNMFGNNPPYKVTGSLGGASLMGGLSNIGSESLLSGDGFRQSLLYTRPILAFLKHTLSIYPLNPL